MDQNFEVNVKVEVIFLYSNTTILDKFLLYTVNRNLKRKKIFFFEMLIQEMTYSTDDFEEFVHYVFTSSKTSIVYAVCGMGKSGLDGLVPSHLSTLLILPESFPVIMALMLQVWARTLWTSKSILSM